jgi:hypothetical protein
MITDTSKITALVFDTETVGLQGHVYDVGYAITDKRGNIALERNWLVLENFTDATKMMGAFYAGAEISEQLNADIREYGVNVVAAYNAGFDERVMRQTNEDLAGDDSQPLVGDFKWLDIWQFACQTKLSQNAYALIARSNGWVSEAGNIKTGAEFCYRYVSGRYDFIEDHTALSDVRIEVAIMAECYRQHKAVPYGVMNGSPWRIVNPLAGEDSNIHGSRVAA